MMQDIKIGSFTVGTGRAPFIIAEMSGNHNGSLERAIDLVDAAAGAGAHALKIQTYTADTMTIDLSEGEFFISDNDSLWNGRSLYDLYQAAHTPWEWHKPIFDRCAEHGMIGFSTPFDETAVDFLEELNVPCYKIASFENTDLPLIRKVAATGKPMIISTGMASLSEIDATVTTARAAGATSLILMKCTSSYPASAANSNLKTIANMRELFDCQIGLSDHTMGIGVAVASVVFGTSVIEKHFTLRRADGGVDSAFSLEPEELAALVHETETAALAIGEVKYSGTAAETSSRQFRRSIYIIADMKAGDVLSTKNMRRIRPGLGLAPKYYDELLGKRVACDISRGMAMRWEFLDQSTSKR